jgi:hypothetical protein
MTSNHQGRVRQIATAVAAVGAVVGAIAIVRAASSEDREVGVPATISGGSPTTEVVESTTNVDELNEALAEQTGAADTPSAATNGLDAEYFTTAGFGGESVTVQGQGLQFDWSVEAPPDGVPGDRFAVRLRGTMTSQVTGDHQFFADTAGRVSLWVNGYRLIQRGDDGAGTLSGYTYLEAGTAVDVFAEYSTGVAGAAPRVGFAWQPPGGEQQPIPTEALAAHDPNVAQMIYASPNGKANIATSAPDAPMSLQRAANLARPGDTVVLLEGVYDNAAEDESAVLKIDRSGSPDRPIVFRPADGATATIQSDNYFAIEMRGSSYVTIQGLQLIGVAPSVTAEEAQAQSPQGNKNPDVTARTGNSGIFANTRWNVADMTSHHVTIAGNTLTQFSGCGVCSRSADNLTIIGNTVTESGWWSAYNVGAIDVMVDTALPAPAGTSITIEGNRLARNETRVANPYTNTDPAQRSITGGGGISIQASNNDADVAGVDPLARQVLIRNNIIDSNGGAGVSVRARATVDIVHNTLFQNGTTASNLITGEIEVQQAPAVSVRNNIVVPRADRNVLRNSDQQPISWGTNLITGSERWGDGQPGGSIIGDDPAFADVASGNLAPVAGSPAIDAGEPVDPAITDFVGTARPQGAAPDLGAYETG